MNNEAQNPMDIVVLGESTKEPNLGNRAIHRIYPVKLPRSLIHDSKNELLSHNPGIGKFTPKQENFLDKYPKTAKLANYLAENLLEGESTDLSFIRATREQNYIYADNLHYDSRYVGYSKQRNIRGSFWRPNRSVEIWRQIINLNNKPRHLQIVDASIQELSENGIDIYQVRPIGQRIDDYQTPVDIPIEKLSGSIPYENSQVYTIPAYDGENLHTLEFWSSRILHSGITSKDGQMIAVAAKWTEPESKSKEGYYA